MMFLKMLLAVSASSCLAQDYWVRLNQAADQCFTGRDVKVTVGGGVEQRSFDSGSRTAPYAELRISVPLYASGERRKQARERATFLEHGADLVRELDKAEGRLRIKMEEARVLKAAMMQEGLKAIRSYFEIRQQIADTRADIRACRKKLEGWFSSCGRK